MPAKESWVITGHRESIFLRLSLKPSLAEAIPPSSHRPPIVSNIPAENV